MDTAILVALALCQAATGFWAFHVSAPKDYGHWRWLFLAITLIAVGLVVYSGIRANSSQSVLLVGIGNIEQKLDKIGAPSASTPSVIRVAHFQMSAKQVPSTNEKLPFQLQITILTDETIEKPAFAITCDGDIGEGHASEGAGAYTMNKWLITDDKRTFAFRWDSPAFTSETPLTAWISAKAPITCDKLTDARAIPFVIRP